MNNPNELCNNKQANDLNQASEHIQYSIQIVSDNKWGNLCQKRHKAWVSIF